MAETAGHTTPLSQPVGAHQDIAVNNLHNIPTEILGLICAYISHRDVLNLRHVCRSFAASVLPYSHRAASIWLREHDIEKLQGLAAQPALAAHLRSLTFHTLDLVRSSSGSGSGNNIVGDSDADDRGGGEPPLTLDEYVDTLSPADQEFEWHADWTVDWPVDVLEIEYGAFRALHAEQCGIARRGDLAAGLTALLPHLARLRSIALVGPARALPLGPHTPQHPFEHPWEFQVLPMCRRQRSNEAALRTVLAALAAAPCPSLVATLDAGQVDWQLFASSSGMALPGPEDPLLQLFRPLDRLEELTLHLTSPRLHDVSRSGRRRNDSSSGDEVQTNNNDGTRSTTELELTRFSETMRSSGALRRLLAGMPCLRVLDVKLFAIWPGLRMGRSDNSTNDDYPSPAAVGIEDVLDPGMTWPHLRRLSLKCVEDRTGGELLLGLLVRHRASLRELSLGAMILSSSSPTSSLPEKGPRGRGRGRGGWDWPSLLREVRGQLTLSKANIHDGLIQHIVDAGGGGGGGGGGSNPLSGNADNGSWIWWDCGRKLLRRTASEYCCANGLDGGTSSAECPLTRDNCRTLKTPRITIYQ
ncbi:hypothetical protein BX600DRAFT_434721 [Xylariales sp. PMI_506]|nr:hypothetical protein BX600DRAFT_434721 [Xylariales sp. PMI_506]